MLWFNGTVRKAVEEVKSSGALLLVFVQGDDKFSKTCETFLSKIKCNHEDCIALKLLNGSRATNQFRAIYGSVPVPSIFLIGTNGIPLEIFSNNITLELLDEAISKAVKTINLGRVKTPNIVHDDPPPEKATNEDPNINTCERECHKRRVDSHSIPKFVFVQSCNDPPPWFLNKLKSLSARIQFRLPSNDTRSWEFPNMCTLHDVRLYLIDKAKLESGFKLFRTYPRTAFTPDDEKKTLSELCLSPSATLIVVPLRDEAVQAKIKRLIVQPNLLSVFLSSIVEPVFNLFNYIKNWFNSRPVVKDKSRDAKKVRSDLSVGKSTNKRTSTSNIHGFRFDDSDTDTDTNTDNGNSTQQK